MKAFLVASLVAVAFVPAPAHAVPSIAYGLTCGMETAGDNPLNEGTTQIGEVEGGPVLALGTVDVRCDVQVGAANSTHSGLDAATVTSGPSLVYAYAAAPVQYVDATAQPVYLCTRWTVNGVAYYYDASSGLFSNSSAVLCVEANNYGAGTFRHYVVAKQYASA